MGEGGEEWTLPIDLGFTAGVLLRLFLKPKLFVSPPRAEFERRTIIDVERAVRNS